MKTYILDLNHKKHIGLGSHSSCIRTKIIFPSILLWDLKIENKIFKSFNPNVIGINRINKVRNRVNSLSKPILIKEILFGLRPNLFIKPKVLLSRKFIKRNFQNIIKSMFSKKIPSFDKFSNLVIPNLFQTESGTCDFQTISRSGKKVP